MSMSLSLDMSMSLSHVQEGHTMELISPEPAKRPTTSMISIDAFAAQRKVATRTVRRWLDAGRVPGAVKVAGKWSLPADAIVQDALPGVMDTVKDTPVSIDRRQHAGSELTVPGVLAPLPVMVPLDTAARVLGVSEYTMRRNADYFELQRMGENGSYVMPKARIRELEG
ncbi:helix-turn-helix DNA binding domain protein [Microbacterium phage Loca]|uniref:Helix-turn-helix DNA binding domain protein n=2 Tax=Microbacterium phage Quaker TaxID=2250352 RepID=A0A2Z5H8F2_9CAUD|nr:helix-turn-helix DNA binding domain protein [Microbacterium phage Quaker]QKY78787.2 helix-turn-helix DNA binding domain protein [Microbacterium phage Livingwater]QYC54915.2 helix-turn-helix DNA binding domain protein [Microbacterium phage Leafy]URM86205.1 helix-turn-helix DNA binding domain protein [Microbacterium phage Loca]UVK59393.1 helix-turn-helix DNA binding domain protein [Microbacterium phage MrGreen]